MASQLLCNASCYERIATSNANADLEQPLVVVQDLESSQSSSSSQIEQNTDIARQRVSILILVKRFCFGAFASLLLQAGTLSTFWVLHKKWGKNTQPDESAPLSNWPLYFVFTIYAAFYILIVVGFVMTLTRKGSTYMRKKFDSDAHAPKSESVWTPRFLVLNGVIFLSGISTGSHVAWAIIFTVLGMSNPPPLGHLLHQLGSCCLMFKCYDWGDDDELWTTDDEPEEDQEEDSFFV